MGCTGNLGGVVHLTQALLGPMIAANGGRIWAESDGIGKGTRFVVEIPVKQSKAPVESKWGGSGTGSSSSG